MVWTFEDAQENFEQLLDAAERDGPQTVQRSEERVVFISETDLRRIQGKAETSDHTCEDTNDVEDR